MAKVDEMKIEKKRRLFGFLVHNSPNRKAWHVVSVSFEIPETVPFSKIKSITTYDDQTRSRVEFCLRTQYSTSRRKREASQEEERASAALPKAEGPERGDV